MERTSITVSARSKRGICLYPILIRNISEHKRLRSNVTNSPAELVAPTHKGKRSGLCLHVYATYANVAAEKKIHHRRGYDRLFMQYPMITLYHAFGSLWNLPIFQYVRTYVCVAIVYLKRHACIIYLHTPECNSFQTRTLKSSGDRSSAPLLLTILQRMRHSCLHFLFGIGEMIITTRRQMWKRFEHTYMVYLFTTVIQQGCSFMTQTMKCTQSRVI